METLTVPQLAVPTAFEAMALVNRWLHREVGMAVHTTVAHFDATTFCWHLPIELAYATHGTLGVVAPAARRSRSQPSRSRLRIVGWA